MTNLLSANQATIQANIKDLEAKIIAQGDKLRIPGSNNLNEYGKALQSLKATYPASHFVFKTSELLKFPDVELGIRDGTPTATCAKPTNSPACVEVTIVSVWHLFHDSLVVCNF